MTKLANYFSERWFNEPGHRELAFVRELLESFFGRNGIYFINKTEELIRAKVKYNKKIPPSVLGKFKITGDAHEDGVIAHAGMIWSLLNGEPWPEAVYHDYVERLVKGGSELTAYVAARLWPARGLLEKVQYRPLSYRIDFGNFTNEDYKDILRQFEGPYSFFVEPDLIPYFLQYRDDFNISLFRIPRYYLEKFGFSHPVCALVTVHEIDNFFVKKVKKILEKDSLSDEIYEALLFLYLHLEVYIKIAKEDKKEVSQILLDLQSYLDIFIKNKIKNYPELDQKTKDFLSIEPRSFKKFVNQFIALYIILSLELGHECLEYHFKEEFNNKIARAIVKLSEDNEDIFENVYFIGEKLVKIIKYIGHEEKIKIEKYIKKRSEEKKFKELLAKLELFNMFLYPEELYDNNLKKLSKIFSRKEIIEMAIKNISDINKDFKIKILEKIMEKEFGESNLKNNKINEDIYLILNTLAGVNERDVKKTGNYGFILYSAMRGLYNIFHYPERPGDPYINKYIEIFKKMNCIFREKNIGNYLDNIMYILERIYFGNFINRDEEEKSINLLFKIINVNRDYIYEDLIKDQELLVDLRKRFILNIEKLREYKNIDELIDILMIRKNYNMHFI